MPRLPVAVGDVVYQIVKNNAFVRKLKVKSFLMLSIDEIYMQCEGYGDIDIEEVGKTIFTDEKIAENILKEKKEKR